MSTLVENVEKVKNAHAALSASIEAKGVSVPAGTKLTDMPALVEQIQTEPVPTNPRAVFAGDSVSSITVPDMLVVDVSEIKDLHYAFYSCTNLKSLTLPAGFGSVATSMDGCFSRCRNLQSLTLPEGCGKHVWNFNYCFEYCDSLSSLSLPAGFGENVNNVYSSFRGCAKLKSIVFPEGFGKKLYNIYAGFYDCSALETITFPAGFGVICKVFTYCFHGCTSLTTINGGIEAKASLDLSPCT